MWQVTVLRIFLIVFVGILLFNILLYMSGWKESIRLKKRRENFVKNRHIRNNKIELAYVTLLTFLITLGFIIIIYKIRGAR